jgi:SAM-dependent methyltransferase
MHEMQQVSREMTGSNRSKLSQSRDYFDSTVGALAHGYFAYRWGATPLRREHYLQTQESLVRGLGSHRFDVMVEVGPGACIWTPLFAQRANRLVAVDLSWAMLRDGKKQTGNWSLSCGDAAALPLRSSAADALCSSRAFEYFPLPGAAVAEFKRVLKPGGFVLIVTKNGKYAGYRPRSAGQSAPSQKDDIHSGNLSPAELVDLFSAHGFENIRVRPAVMGRSRLTAAWTAVRWIRRLADPSWRYMPTVIADACESVMLTAWSPRVT